MIFILTQLLLNKDDNGSIDLKKDYMDYTKTDRYLILLRKLCNAPRLTLTEGEVLDILENPSRAQFYKYIAELTEDKGERLALMKKIQDGETTKYTLHNENWFQVIDAEKENIFLLKSYKQLGYLLPENELQRELLSDYKDLDRKFYYLAPISAKPYTNGQNKMLELIIRSLSGNKKLLIKYDDKTTDIYPLTLCQYRDDLYLLSFKSEMKEENYRAYKVSRIQNVELLTEEFRYPGLNRWNPVERFKEASGLILGEVKSTRFKVYGNSKNLLREKRFFKTVHFEEGKDFDLYECQYTNVEEFVGQLFVYGQDIELIEDSEVKVKFVEKANAILKRNK